MDVWQGWVQSYFAHYGYAFVFAALFLENVLFLGALVPGAVVLVLCGWLAQKEGAGELPYALIAVGFLGTIAGDSVSYTIGKKAGGRLLRSPKWGKAVSSMSARVRSEPLLLVSCHFVSYLRLVVPLSAGLSGVPFFHWLRLDATGAALWVTTHILLGYFLSVSTASRYMSQLAGIVLAVLVVCLGVRLLLKRRSGKIASR